MFNLSFQRLRCSAATTQRACAISPVLVVIVLSAVVECSAAELPVRVDVLIQPQPTYQLHTRAWGPVFQKLGRTVKFRTGEPGERTRVEDQEFRGRKSVTVVGIMNRNGTISFPQGTYHATAPGPLGEWLDRLAAYGAAGPPEESPTWGLTEEELAEVLKLLSTPVDQPVGLKTPMTAIDSIRLPTKFRIRFTDAGRKRAFPRVTYTDDQTDAFKGLSKGSVLAASLAQFGLGFRPLRDEGGRYLIEIDAGGEADNLYPIGWKNTTPIMNVVPDLGRSLTVELEEVQLEALIELIAQRLKLTYFPSSYALATDGKHLPTMIYSRKDDRLTMGRLIDVVGRKNDIALSLRTDEAGTVFLWVTTPEENGAFRKRFQHVRPVP